MLVAIALTGAFCFAKTNDSPLLARWFWNPSQKEGVLLAVGYSGAYFNEPSSYQEAFCDAAN